jgi:hypothetical protein
MTFGIAAVFGVGAAFSVSDATIDHVYEVPNQDVNFMYTMVHDPASYTAHGPLLVTVKSNALTWTNYYDAISYTHTDTGFVGSSACCAMIDAAAGVLTTPWQAVTLVRSADAVTVRIYDTPTPEPSSAMLLAVAAMTISLTCRPRAGMRRSSV